MKKTIVFTILVVGFIVTAKAQKVKRNKLERLTVKQQTILAVKKMTLQLDLTSTQQRIIKPLLAEKFRKRKMLNAKRKALKENGNGNNSLSADERFRIASKTLDNRIAFKKEMKRILNNQQYERFEKIWARKKQKNRKRLKLKKLRKNSKAS